MAACGEQDVNEGDRVRTVSKKRPHGFLWPFLRISRLNVCFFFKCKTLPRLVPTSAHLIFIWVTLRRDFSQST